MADDPVQLLHDRNWISFNMDGIWGGNMYGGGAGAILPNKITSKHNMRYVPNQTGPDLVKKIRAFLDSKGFQDVELKLIGDVPWSKMRYDTDVAHALRTTYDIFGISYTEPAANESILGGYWPAYLFVNDEKSPIKIPIVGGAAGHGGGGSRGGELDVGHRPHVAGSRRGEDDGGQRVAGIGAGLQQPVVQHLRQARIGPERARGDGRRGVGDRARDVDVHVVPAGQQQRDDDRRTPLGRQPGDDVNDGGRLDVDEGRGGDQPGTLRPGGEGQLGDQPAAGGITGAVGAGDEDRSVHRARVTPPSTAIIVPVR
jgi:hypothetical protein